MTDRERILSEIREERRIQETRYSASNDDCLSGAAWVAILCRHVGLAIDDGGTRDFARFRRQMVRVAATALAAVEALDRLLPPDLAVGQPLEERTDK